MNEEKLFPKQVEESCHSWTCKGVLRTFERVYHASIEQPVFSELERIGPQHSPRLPFAHQEPTSFGMCVNCGTTRFIGPTFGEVDAYVKAHNAETERKRHAEEDRKFGESLTRERGAVGKLLRKRR